MLHHLSLGVTQIERAAAFYDAALRPLGYLRVWSDLRPGESGQAVGYGPPGGGDKLALKQVQGPVLVPVPVQVPVQVPAPVQAPVQVQVQVQEQGREPVPVPVQVQVADGSLGAMPGFHLAFSAASRQAVAEFHAAALAAGGSDNGPPGLREHYGPGYYAAFVIDPEGHHLEAVCKGAG